MRTPALMLAVILAFLACYSPVHAGSASVSITIIAAPDRAKRAEEGAIAREIATGLAANTRLAGRRLTVIVRDGIVVLEGRVMDEAERVLAVRIAAEAMSGRAFPRIANEIVALSDFMPTTLARNGGTVAF